MNEIREQAMQKSGRRAFQAEENCVQRPKEGRNLAYSVNSKKVRIMGAE